MNIKLDELRRLCFTLDRRQFLTLIQRNVVLHGEEVILLDQIKVLFAEWLIHLGFVTDLQIQTLLKRFNSYLDAFSTEVQGCFTNGKFDKTHLPQFGFRLVEERWIVSMGESALFWYDFVYEKELETLPEPPVTLFGLSLTGLYCRAYNRIMEMRGGKDAGREAEPVVKRKHQAT